MHSYDVEQVPFEPLVTSLNHEWFDQANCGVAVFARPVATKMDATMGELALVPPYTSQPAAPAEAPPYVS